MSGSIVETIIGAVVIAVAGFFLTYAYTSTGSRGVGGYPLVAKFDKVDGLTIGGDVRMSGIKVGTVTGQSLDPESYRAVVNFTVDSSIKIPDDSAAKIASLGLLGGNYLALEPGGSENVLKPGEEVRYTQGAVSLLDLIGQAIFSSTGGGGSNGGGKQ
jgi:phospholipid/cholesterol/gamma-HCH transport system substrate-binding protein